MLKYFAMSMLALTLAACAAKEEKSAAAPAEQNINSLGSNSSANRNSNVSNVSPLDIKVGSYPSGLPVSCDTFNPDDIKYLSTEVIRWMAEILPNGLTRHEHFAIVRDTGYNDTIGEGGHAAFTAAVPGRQQAFENYVAAFANQAAPPYASLRAHHVALRASGYQGVFVCGGAACWQAGGCDNLGRRK